MGLTRRGLETNGRFTRWGTPREQRGATDRLNLRSVGPVLDPTTGHKWADGPHRYCPVGPRCLTFRLDRKTPGEKLAAIFITLDEKWEQQLRHGTRLRWRAEERPDERQLDAYSIAY